MSKLPIVDARSFERILLKWGFVIIRQKGSQVAYAQNPPRILWPDGVGPMRIGPAEIW